MGSLTKALTTLRDKRGLVVEPIVNARYLQRLSELRRGGLKGNEERFSPGSAIHADRSTL